MLLSDPTNEHVLGYGNSLQSKTSKLHNLPEHTLRANPRPTKDASRFLLK